MHSQARIALAHPIYDPTNVDVRPLTWMVAPRVSALLSVNIGMN